MGKATLNVPVTQMVRTGAMRRSGSVQVATFPLASQLEKDIWEEEEEEEEEFKMQSGERVGL